MKKVRNKVILKPMSRKKNLREITGKQTFVEASKSEVC